MHESNPQELPHQRDDRPRRFRDLALRLREPDLAGRWQTLSDDELHGLVVPPGDRGVAGPDESRTLLNGLYAHGPRVRDGVSFESRVATGEHQVRSVSVFGRKG